MLRRKKDGAKLVYKLLQIVFERKTNILRVDRVSIVFPEVQILCKTDDVITVSKFIKPSG